MCTALRERLGSERSCSLDLDITGINEHKFNSNLNDCLKFDYVIGMMFYGNSHTEQPQTWISKFKDVDYRILSVVLHATMDTCYERCKNDRNPNRHPINRQKNQCNKYYHQFELLQTKIIFRKRAEVEEITIDCEEKSQRQVSEEILKYLDLIER